MENCVQDEGEAGIKGVDMVTTDSSCVTHRL